MSRFQKTLALSLIVLTLVAAGAIARPLSLTFTHTSTGYLHDDGLGGGPIVVPNTPAAWGLNGVHEYRGFLSFDASSMNSLNFPIVSKVEFFYGASISMVEHPAPNSFDAQLYIGDFLADGLNASDWSAGNYAASQSWTHPVNTWIDLGKAGIQMFYVIGDDYIGFEAPDSFGVAIRNVGSGNFIAGTRHCKIRVTYTTSFNKTMATEESSFGSIKSLYR